jgi:hypothetical protein
LADVIKERYEDNLNLSIYADDAENMIIPKDLISKIWLE